MSSFSNDSVGVKLVSSGKVVSVYSGEARISSFFWMFGMLLCIERTAEADKCDMDWA